jgi:hypothetical protein
MKNKINLIIMKIKKKESRLEYYGLYNKNRFNELNKKYYNNNEILSKMRECTIKKYYEKKYNFEEINKNLIKKYVIN